MTNRQTNRQTDRQTDKLFWSIVDQNKGHSASGKYAVSADGPVEHQKLN